jgi:NAD(P)-dependent dehydrogenase (short-subunit alcohol dehydrogenase family)
MSTIYPSLSGKRVLITGASKGIGRAIALRFAENGCDIAATGRNGEELSSLAAQIREMGRRCEVLAADLSSRSETLEMAKSFAGTGVDVLVNNAGLSFPETITDLDPDHWDTTIQVNLTAPALITSVMAPSMIAQKSGAIVNVSSAAGSTALIEHAAYCASKFGLNGLTKVLALELGPHNIRVNAVAPTVTLTPMAVQVWSAPEKRDPMLSQIPLGRFVEPGEVADAVLFLASDSAAMISGEVLLIDGGFTTH